MSLDGQGVIAADGTAVVVIKNDNPVNGFLAEFFTVQGQDTLDGICRIYRGLGIGENSRLAGSALGRNDQAEGPYYLASGGVLTFVFSEMTPGVNVIVSHVGTVVTTPPQQQGKLTFANPLPVDKSAQPVTETRLEYIDVSQTTNVLSGNLEISTIQPPVIGVYYRLVALQLFAFDVPGATTGHHFFQIEGAGPGGISVANMFGYSWWPHLLSFNGMAWYWATKEVFPENPAAQVIAIQSYRAELGAAIEIVYKNDTDATQTVDRTITALVERTALGNP
jgi:hypothetical protein